MSMSVALTLTLRDMLSAPARAALEAVRASAQRTGAGMGQINAGADAARSSMYRLSTSAQAALDMIRGRARTAAASVDQMAKSSTGAAIEAGRLAREAGEVARQRMDGLRASIESARQTADAARQSIERLRQGVNATGNTRMQTLHAELTRVQTLADNASRALRGMGTAASAGSAAAAGAWAAKSAAIAALQNPVRFDDQITKVAKVFYSDQDTTPEQRRVGRAELADAVMGAVRHGGGTREGAVSALDVLASSGVFDKKTALERLPGIQQVATASNADPADIARQVVGMKRNMGIADDRIDPMLSKAMAAGQAGSFEMKDMSVWLDRQMARARALGMSGEAGYEKLVMMNQMAAITAGSRDEAGNNVVNWLNKINSPDTAKDVAKFLDKATGKPIKLSKLLVDNRLRGVDAVDAFNNLTESIASSNPEYARLRARVDSAKTADEQRQAILDASEIMKGSAVSSVLQDSQAMSGYLGWNSNSAYKSSVQAAMNNAATAIPRASAWDRDSIGEKARTAEAEKDNAATRALSEVEGPLGKMLGVLSDTAEAYPKLTTGAYAAATALGVLAAAAGAAGLTSRILQRGAGAPRVPTPAPAPGAPTPAGRAPTPTTAPAPAGQPPVPAPRPAGAPIPPVPAPAPPAVPPATPRTAGIAEAARNSPGAPPATLTANRGRQAYLDALARESARGATVRADVVVQQSRVGAVRDAARAQPLGKANVALAAGMGLYTAYQIEQQHLPQRQRVVEHAKNAGGVVGSVGGGWAGAAAGAALGAPLAPFTGGLSVPVMAALGGIGGGIGGGMGGQRIIELLTELLAEQKKPAPPPPPPPPVQITNNMVVDGSVVTSVVNDINAREVRRAH